MVFLLQMFGIDMLENKKSTTILKRLWWFHWRSELQSGQRQKYLKYPSQQFMREISKLVLLELTQVHKILCWLLNIDLADLSIACQMNAWTRELATIVFKTISNLIDVDEKWFFLTKIKIKNHRYFNDKIPYRDLASKQSITKVMYLTCIATL
jgi:hypothetical protein